MEIYGCLGWTVSLNCIFYDKYAKCYKNYFWRLQEIKLYLEVIQTTMGQHIYGVKNPELRMNVP